LVRLRTAAAAAYTNSYHAGSNADADADPLSRRIAEMSAPATSAAKSTAQGVAPNGATTAAPTAHASASEQTQAEEEMLSDDSSEELDYTADPFYDAAIDDQNEEWFEKFCSRNGTSWPPPAIPLFVRPPRPAPHFRSRFRVRIAHTCVFFAFLMLWFSVIAAEPVEQADTTATPGDASSAKAEQPNKTQSTRQQRKRTKKKQQKKQKGPRVTCLTCPCCFTLLCTDSQRHAKYPDQFRAAFSCNCQIVSEEKIINEVDSDDDGGGDDDDPIQGERDMRRSTATAPRRKVEILHPVLCAECKTEVGVIDEDEIYHFFEVIPS